MKSPKGPGDRIEARCTRCRDVTGHVVVALVGGQIVKVECCACGSVHKYYPAKEEKTVTAAAPRRVRAGSDRTALMQAAQAKQYGGTRALHKAQAMENTWRTALERPSAPAPKLYTMGVVLAVGDIVEHSVFGMGAVQAIIRPDKAEIIFREGVRLLRCAC